ncbi:hypothetical protein QBC47DRAFT_48633 [Echria macrotheca]|uniref:Helicase C-terminal domain-containing protein n=1 Tax=Echria macrotheca TaxID=438768 RepID=A0AAJ0F401_9PEZI|nr:hypothetical protein QBC47DRAFT_48633 [Echria macrotheca]
MGKKLPSAVQTRLSTHRAGCRKLMTLYINFKRPGSNASWAKRLIEFTASTDGQKRDAVLTPTSYPWTEIQRWLTWRLDYNTEEEMIMYGRGKSETVEIEREATFHDILKKIAISSPVLPNGHVYFTIRPKVALQELAIEVDETEISDSELDSGELPQSIDSTSGVGGGHVHSDVLEICSVPNPPDLRASMSHATVPELDQANGTQYETRETLDDDYGALDNTIVDTYLGSFNAGDTEEQWGECMKFFLIDAKSYAKAPSQTATKRVPFVKLPGMSVGLFDYQLMGVFNLLRLPLRGGPGGFLSDEQGLGKTVEMLGLIALVNGLRKCKAEVLSAREDSNAHKTKHNRPGTSSKACPSDRRYGFRCYCYYTPTQELADNLEDGPSIVITPSRNCHQVLQEAKSKLDLTTFKVRLHHETAKKQDILTPAEIRSLTTGSASSRGGDMNSYAIITPPPITGRSSGSRGFDTLVGKTPGRKTGERCVPGLVLLDECHEYVHGEDGETHQNAAWLESWLKPPQREHRKRTPLVYFVSGTPMGESPGDIRPAISILQSVQVKAWPELGDPTASLDEITATYNILHAAQSRGVPVDPQDILQYRRRLNRILERTMVRRLGTDTFRGVPLTRLGRMRVDIVDHDIPGQFAADVQLLADETATRLQRELEKQDTHDIHQLLRSNTGKGALEHLLLAASFPRIASSIVDREFTFSPSELADELTVAGQDVTKTRYFANVPRWAKHSPKIATIDGTVTMMLTDKSRIEGESSHAKKLVVFCPLEAEALLVYAHLLVRKTTGKQAKGAVVLKPVFINSVMTQSERDAILDQFLAVGNAPPNVLVAPISLAGTGLNLQRAKYSIVTGPAWTKRDNQQAFYRIHRVGQKQKTQLQLLTARWNPAERIVLAHHAGKTAPVEEMWTVRNGIVGVDNDGLVERHQAISNDQETPSGEVHAGPYQITTLK